MASTKHFVIAKRAVWEAYQQVKAKLYNPIICGWWKYYGAFYPTAMLDLYMHIDRALERWARRKYKTLSGRLRAGVQWLRKMKDAEPQLFHHLRLIGSKVG